MKEKSKAKRIIKATALSLVVLMLAAVISAGLVLYGRIATVMSAKQIGNRLYTVDYQQNYHLDKALGANIKNENALFDFICDEFYFGYHIDSNVQKFACSAFLTDMPDGKKAVGRNFDLSSTETLSVYTHPKDGYASISTVNLDVMSVGSPNATDPMSIAGRLAMLAAPYICVDGVNEKGLSVSLLDLDYEKVHENTGKPALLILVAVRMILDRAADVDEAVELLRGYDIHTVEKCTQHMFLADKSGKAIVVEWHKDEMKLVESPVCTNFRLSAKALEGNFSGQCERFDLLDKALEEQPENTAEESMKLLEAVKQEYPEYGIFTEWSAVFHLSDFSVDYAVNMDYDTVYHLDPHNF